MPAIEQVQPHQVRFWKALADILEAVKPVIIEAVEQKAQEMKNERERLQYRNPSR